MTETGFEPGTEPRFEPGTGPRFEPGTRKLYCSVTQYIRILYSSVPFAQLALHVPRGPCNFLHLRNKAEYISCTHYRLKPASPPLSPHSASLRLIYDEDSALMPSECKIERYCMCTSTNKPRSVINIGVCSAKKVTVS